ncbi:hypothetical protein [uncultured Clostridium sp.]|uniref:hypothetical protein n=1 Tax=uncultured Clostridium sp. TaxID=59620 RepID=UPI0026222E58|nr:hypothetical protein [uncultured Clostridium sp.]
MSELGYGSTAEVPSGLSIKNDKIISYLMGSYVDNTKKKSFIGNIFNMFNQGKSYLVAFMDDNMVIGELEKGNASNDDTTVLYSEVKSFNYYNQSGSLEIITDKNFRYLIKVSKHELCDTMKHLNGNLAVKYLN